MRVRGFDAPAHAAPTPSVDGALFRNLNTCRRHGHGPDDLQPCCINFSLTIRRAKRHFVKYQFAAADGELHSPTACVIAAGAKPRASRALKSEMKTNGVMLLRQRR